MAGRRIDVLDDVKALDEYTGELMDTADWIETFGITLLRTDGQTVITREDLEGEGALPVHPDSMRLLINTAINMHRNPIYLNEPDATLRLKMLATAEAFMDASL